MTGNDYSASDALAVGLDIGGTKIAGGVVDAAGKIVEPLMVRPTPHSQDGIVSTLLEMITQFRERQPAVAAVGAGTAGLVDWPSGFVRWAPNNPYDAMPLRERLQEATGLTAVVDNDANAAAWAQFRLGTAADYMLFVTVGTGVGGGIVLDGRIFRGRSGIGAEIGHIIVDPRSDAVCGCGNRGCLEALASGNALGRLGREVAARDPDGLLAALAGGADQVSGLTVFRAAAAGDPTARSLYQETGRWLGIGLASLVTILDLDLIVVGGSVVEAGDLLLDPVRTSLGAYVFAADQRAVPPVIAAETRSEAGWIGAGLLALDADGSRSAVAMRPAVPQPAAARE